MLSARITRLAAAKITDKKVSIAKYPQSKNMKKIDMHSVKYTNLGIFCNGIFITKNVCISHIGYIR